MLAGFALVLLGRLREMSWLDRVSTSSTMLCVIGVLSTMAAVEFSQVESGDVLANYFSAPPAMLSLFASLFPARLLIAEIRRSQSSRTALQALASELHSTAVDAKTIDEAMRSAFRDNHISYSASKFARPYLDMHDQTLTIASTRCGLALSNAQLRSDLRQSAAMYETVSPHAARRAERERVSALVAQKVATRLEATSAILSANAIATRSDALDQISDDLDQALQDIRRMGSAISSFENRRDDEYDNSHRNDG